MEEIGKRIDNFLNTRGLNRKEYCKKSGEDYSSFSHMCRGARVINKKQIDLLVKTFPEIDLNYVLKEVALQDHTEVFSEPELKYRAMNPDELIAEAMQLLELAKKK